MSTKGPGERAKRGINYLRTLADRASQGKDKEGFQAVAALVQSLSKELGDKAREAARGNPLTLQEAEIIMGPEDFIGPAALEKILGVILPITPEQVPQVPFTVEDLEAAKQTGHFLRLRVPFFARGKCSNMGQAQEVIEPKLKDLNLGEMLFQEGFRYMQKGHEAFDEVEVPNKPTWALEPKSLIPGTAGKNLFEQMQILADYVQQQVFKKGAKIPSKWQEALDEFESQKARISNLNSGKEGSLVGLKLAQLAMRSPIQAMIANSLYLLHTGNRLFSADYEVTKIMSDNGNPLYVGAFSEHGHSFRVIPQAGFPRGITFSRTV